MLQDIPLLQELKSQATLELKLLIFELKSHALELLNVLLEETSNQSFELLQKLSQEISIDTILEAMLDLWVSSMCGTCSDT